MNIVVKYLMETKNINFDKFKRPKILIVHLRVF